MISRRARPRYRVAIEIPHAGDWRAWNAAAGAFEQRLAAQASPVVLEPRLESETRRGGDVVRVRIAMTVRAADPGQAAVIAWDVLKVAAGRERHEVGHGRGGGRDPAPHLERQHQNAPPPVRTTGR